MYTPKYGYVIGILQNNMVRLNRKSVTITGNILSVKYNMNVFAYKETFYNISFS